MGCGCVTQSQAQGPPRQFLANSDAEFVRSLSADELKDKKRLLNYFHLLHEGQFEATKAFTEQVRRKGVPDRFRWQAWRALTGWSSLYKPGVYERLLQRQPERKVEDAVQKDLDRTFPKLEEFNDEKKQQLGAMLGAYACLIPQVGYCQGMNFIGGFLLLASPNSHEDAFYMFVQMMVKYRTSLMFAEGLPMLKLMTFQYRALLEEVFPEVHKHFLQEGITPELYITKWLLTLFVQPLDFASACRVWDLIVCDGIEAVLLACLAAVQLLRARLLRQDTEGILELLSLHKDTGPPTGGEIVQAALNLKLPRGWQESLSSLREAWGRENTEEAAELERAEIAFCTPILSAEGLQGAPGWNAPTIPAEPPSPFAALAAGSPPAAAPAGSPAGFMPGRCFAPEPRGGSKEEADALPSERQISPPSLAYMVAPEEARLEPVLYTSSVTLRPSGDCLAPTTILPTQGDIDQVAWQPRCALEPVHLAAASSYDGKPASWPGPGSPASLQAERPLMVLTSATPTPSSLGSPPPMTPHRLVEFELDGGEPPAGRSDASLRGLDDSPQASPVSCRCDARSHAAPDAASLEAALAAADAATANNRGLEDASPEMTEAESGKSLAL